MRRPRASEAVVARHPEGPCATLEMARPEGFEPPTNGFGSHYSIRLSYGRVAETRGVAGRAFSHDRR
jgi:hypothetical protein